MNSVIKKQLSEYLYTCRHKDKFDYHLGSQARLQLLNFHNDPVELLYPITTLFDDVLTDNTKNHPEPGHLDEKVTQLIAHLVRCSEECDVINSQLDNAQSNQFYMKDSYFHFLNSIELMIIKVSSILDLCMLVLSKQLHLSKLPTKFGHCIYKKNGNFQNPFNKEF